MPLTIKPVNYAANISINIPPNECPYCHHLITPDLKICYLVKDIFEVLFHCTNQSCGKGFIGYYKSTDKYGLLVGVSFGSFQKKTFIEPITKVSPLFESIYNEAYQAEQLGLNQICGVGYRKAIEFLIKDYTIENNPEKEEHIKRIALAGVIGEYVADEKIKSVAKRAVWLGNDETHYVRKWEDRDLNDLKILINLVVHWIEMEILTKTFEGDMPD